MEQTQGLDPTKPALNPLNQLPQRMPDQPALKRPAMALPANRLKMSENVVRHYTIDIPQQHTPEDVSEETYWVHHARQLRIGDKIDAISETGQWEVTLRVVAKGDTWARVRLLSAYDAKGKDETSIPMVEQYDLTFIPGASNGWRVMHKESRTIIADKIQSKDEAIRIRDKHLTALSARA